MSQADVLDLLYLADDLGIVLWIDGGWGVDAVLGRQTRRHDDLDILIERRHEPTFAAALRARGFMPVDRDDTRPWNYVLGDARGREVDFHVIESRPEGDWHYGPEGGESEDVIPTDALMGSGEIAGRKVSCLTPEALVGYHTGYAVDANDWADVRALCERFDIPVPPDYAPFQSGDPA
jgi:lincosamide nucleotidyltransferase A/C/D/E